MSVICLKLDSLETFYHRMIMVLYTRVSRDKLAEYLGGLELLAEDRQETFFKIDLDIQVPPKDMQLDKWLIVTINMKSTEKKSMNLFINLFYMNFIHKTSVNQKTEDTFLASGNTSGRPLYPADIDAYRKLSAFLKENQDNVAHCAEEFRSETRCSDTVVDVMIHLAGKYKLHGGHWLCFFQELAKSKYEQVFDYLMNAFCAPENKHHANRFNAKLSCDPEIMKLRNNTDDQGLGVSWSLNRPYCDSFLDEEVCKVRQFLDRIYKPEILGSLCMKYKPDIVSNCCIQRNSLLRPTVYTRNYLKRYEYYIRRVSSGRIM